MVYPLGPQSGSSIVEPVSIEMMNFVLETRNCVLKTRNFVFEMINFAACALRKARAGSCHMIFHDKGSGGFDDKKNVIDGFFNEV